MPRRIRAVLALAALAALAACTNPLAPAPSGPRADFVGYHITSGSLETVPPAR